MPPGAGERGRDTGGCGSGSGSRGCSSPVCPEPSLHGDPEPRAEACPELPLWSCFSSHRGIQLAPSCCLQLKGGRTGPCVRAGTDTVPGPPPAARCGCCKHSWRCPAPLLETPEKGELCMGGAFHEAGDGLEMNGVRKGRRWTSYIREHLAPKASLF